VAEILRLGCSPIARLDRVDAFDDARPEAFTSINGEAGSDDFWVWLPCLMITGQANRQSFKCLLAGSHDSVGLRHARPLEADHQGEAHGASR
jgi:hypothetical protein